MTESEFLETLSWQEIAIIRYESSYMLVLICQDDHRAAALLNFLLTNSYGLRVSMDSITGEYSLHFGMMLLELNVTYTTGKTITTYPPLQMLGRGEVNYLTTGVMVSERKVAAFKPISLENRERLN